MFSFAGDTILDPFGGTGSTAMAALLTGRNSLSNEIELQYHNQAVDRLREAAWLPRSTGAVNGTVTIDE
jgi:DNA modification methylase